MGKIFWALSKEAILYAPLFFEKGNWVSDLKTPKVIQLIRYVSQSFIKVEIRILTKNTKKTPKTLNHNENRRDTA